MTLQQVQCSTTQLLRPSPGQRTTGHKVTLVKEQCRFDNEKVLILMENNKCMEKHSVNVFKTESTDSYLTRTGYTPRWKSVGLSFCQLASLSACNLELVILRWQSCFILLKLLEPTLNQVCSTLYSMLIS